MDLLLIFSLVVNLVLLIWNFKLIDEKTKVENKWYKRYAQLKNQCLEKDFNRDEIEFKDE